MSYFLINGGKHLHGHINISGAKNSSLIILPAAILGSSKSVIKNVPDISDVRHLLEIIESIGGKTSFSNSTVNISPEKINSVEPAVNLIHKLRASVVLVGPLLAKYGKAIISQPGGCLIGARPIDEHLDVFQQMGIKIKTETDKYILTGKPKACDITLNKMSVSATENAIMASVFVNGITKIHVAAAEPEIVDLVNFLNKMGAKISGAGTHEITITGVPKLDGVEHTVIPDRVEAGTYLIAAIATNSSIEIGPIISDHMNILFKKLSSVGAKFKIIKKDDKEYILTQKRGVLNHCNIDTRTYPGFCTDLQPQFSVLMTLANGLSNIFETLFEGRFLYLDELKLMGANTEILSPHIIEISGPTELKGREIYSRDIRGGAALTIAALIAKGTTIIRGIDFIDRGYEKMDTKFKLAGADIQRVNEN